MGLGNAYYNRANTKADAAAKRRLQARGRRVREGLPAQDRPTPTWRSTPRSPTRTRASWRSPRRSGARCSRARPTTRTRFRAWVRCSPTRRSTTRRRQALQRAVELKPEEKVFFRQLAAVYSKQGNNPKTTEMMFVYLPMANGQQAAGRGGGREDHGARRAPLRRTRSRAWARRTRSTTGATTRRARCRRGSTRRKKLAFTFSVHGRAGAEVGLEREEVTRAAAATRPATP